MVRKIIEQEPITLSEVKNILRGGKKKSSEMGYVQTRAVSHADKFAKIPKESAAKLVEELTALNIPKDKSVEITNILPKSIEELRVLFAREKPTETAKLQQILDTVAKYR